MADFLSSRGSLIVVGILLLAGCACFYLSSKDADSARHEKTTIGVIDGLSGGRGTTYYYKFEIDGVTLYDESGSCRTALTPKGCAFGASVLVYYAQNPTLETKLKEFGAASSDDLATGLFMVFVGLFLTVLHFLFRRALENTDESDDDADRPDGHPDAIHVVPDE